MKRHAQLAQTMGMSEGKILITDIGNCVELTDNSMKFGENVQAGTRLIDGAGVEDYGTSEVMKDRLKMSSDGVFSVALVRVNGSFVVNAPVIEAHGCVFAGQDMEAELRAIVCRCIENYNDGYEEERLDIAVAVKKAVKNHFYKKTKQAPLLIVSVVEA